MPPEASARAPGLLPAPGDLVVVAGGGVSGLAVLRYLVGLGCRVVVTADREAPVLPADLAPAVTLGGRIWRPRRRGPHCWSPRPVFARPRPCWWPRSRPGRRWSARSSWPGDSTGPAGPRDWLVVTGTNGKTTTVGMLESILRAAGRVVTACGNIGWPALDAVLAEPRTEHRRRAVQFSAALRAVGAAARRAGAQPGRRPPGLVRRIDAGLRSGQGQGADRRRCGRRDRRSRRRRTTRRSARLPGRSRVTAGRPRARWAGHQGRIPA